MDNKGGAGATLRKHLGAVGINEWDDITRTALYDLRDHLGESVSAGSAKTILAYFKSLLNRYSDELTLPGDWAKILSAKGDASRGTYLTIEELRAFESVPSHLRKERLVQVESLIEAYTGARVSDVMTFSEENFKDGYLTYTSIKTKVTATVPISEKTRGWIAYAQSHRDDEPTLPARNIIIRRIAKKAGITAPVKTRRGGVESVKPKYEVLSSHCFRRSCATNMANAGASLTDIRFTMGHTNESMSSRYIVASRPALSQEAMTYFK